MKKFIDVKKTHKGSGIVTVLIAIIFLTVLGSMLLMLSFTGFEIKLSERKGNQNYYDAEVAMGEIRTGFQEVCSDAISDSMYDYLVNASADLAGATETFNNSFMNIIGDWVMKDNDGNKIPDELGHDIPLLLDYNNTKVNCNFNPDALALMVKNCRKGVVTINVHDDLEEDEITEVSEQVYIRKSSSLPESKAVFNRDDGNGKVTFKNISITYTEGDRSTTITTDISVTVPDLASISAGMDNTDIENFALVSAGTVKQTGSSTASTILGSTYIGNLDANNLSLNNGTIIIKNGINAKDSTTGVLQFGSTSTVYVENIEVKNSAIELRGNTFVANDLNLKGAADVTVAGKYYGFGSSLNDPKKSSSIIANGSDSSLDISGCGEMVLSGFSFIADEEKVTNASVRTGESVSVRPNQIVYLADCKALHYTEDDSSLSHNPVSYNIASYPDGYPEVALDKNAVVFTFTNAGTEEQRRYSDYGAEVKQVITNYAQQALVYYFLEFSATEGFSATENANRYFRDYYSAHPEELDKYIKNYITISRANGDKKVSGNAFTYEGYATETPRLWDVLSNQEREALISSSKTFDTYFSNYIKYLSAGKPADALDPEKEHEEKGADDKLTEEAIVKKYNDDGSEYYVTERIIKPRYDNPFYNKIDYYKLNEYSDTKISGIKYFTNAETVAVICSGDYSFPTSFNNAQNIRLIICQGNLTIEAGTTFNGLIMCSGDITVNGEVHLGSDSASFNKAVDAKANDGTSIKLYFRNYIPPTDVSEINYAGTSSMVFALVKYENWKKN